MRILHVIKYVLSGKYRQELANKDKETEKIWHDLTRNLSFVITIKSEGKFFFPYEKREVPDDILSELKVVDAGQQSGNVYQSLQPIIRINLNLGLLIGNGEKILGAVIWWEGDKGKYKYPIQLDSILLNASILPRLQSRIWHILNNWFEEIKRSS